MGANPKKLEGYTRVGRVVYNIIVFRAEAPVACIVQMNACGRTNRSRDGARRKFYGLVDPFPIEEKTPELNDRKS